MMSGDLSRQEIRRAWRSLLGGERVASGVDGVRPASLLGHKADELRESERLWRHQDEWRNRPLRRLDLQRWDAGRLVHARTVWMPTVLSSVMLSARLKWLERRGVWNLVHPNIIGGRPGVSLPELVRDEIWPHRVSLQPYWVLKLDLVAGFENTPKREALRLLRERGRPEWQEQIARIHDLYRIAPGKGLPAGLATSPLLLALVLHEALSPVLDRHAPLGWHLYVDDVLALVRTERDAEALEASLRRALLPYGKFSRFHCKTCKRAKHVSVAGHETWSAFGFRMSDWSPVPSTANCMKLIALVTAALGERDEPQGKADYALSRWAQWFGRALVTGFEEGPFLALEDAVRAIRVDGRRVEDVRLLERLTGVKNAIIKNCPHGSTKEGQSSSTKGRTEGQHGENVVSSEDQLETRSWEGFPPCATGVSGKTQRWFVQAAASLLWPSEESSPAWSAARSA